MIGFESASAWLDIPYGQIHTIRTAKGGWIPFTHIAIFINEKKK